MRGIMAHLRAGHRVCVQGGARGLTARLDGAAKLLAGRPTGVMPFALFRAWRGFERYAESETGAALRPFLNLVRAYGLPKLRDSLGRLSLGGTFETGVPSVTVALARLTKGRWWRRVRLGSDFVGPADPDFDVVERNLLYLAVTRAREVLDVSEITNDSFGGGHVGRRA